MSCSTALHRPASPFQHLAEREEEASLGIGSSSYNIGLGNGNTSFYMRQSAYTHSIWQRAWAQERD